MEKQQPKRLSELLDELKQAQAVTREALERNRAELDAIEKVIAENEEMTKALGDGCPYTGICDE